MAPLKLKRSPFVYGSGNCIQEKEQKNKITDSNGLLVQLHELNLSQNFFYIRTVGCHFHKIWPLIL